MADKQKQHYVPQCYLRGFLNGNRRLFSFNKRHPTKPAVSYSTCSVAWSESFHDLDASMFVDSQKGPHQVEDNLSKVEDSFRKTLDVFLVEAANGQVRLDLSHEFAQFVALQWLRTETARRTLVATDLAFKQAALNVLSRTNPEVPAGRLVAPDDYDKILHLSFLTSNSSIHRMSKRFASMVWIIGRNASAIPIYTSDSPVVRFRNPPQDDPECVNSDTGLIFVFPLNSQYVLFMAERYMASQVCVPPLSERDRRTEDFDSSDIAFCNKLQVQQSGQYVYCQVDEFDFARQLCQDDPRICDPDRDRIQITAAEQTGEKIQIFARFLE